MFPNMQTEAAVPTVIEAETTEPNDEFLWHEDQPAKLNYEGLGERLAHTGQLFRSSEGGLILYTGAVNPVPITKGSRPRHNKPGCCKSQGRQGRS